MTSTPATAPAAPWTQLTVSNSQEVVDQLNRMFTDRPVFATYVNLGDGATEPVQLTAFQAMVLQIRGGMMGLLIRGERTGVTSNDGHGKMFGQRVSFRAFYQFSDNSATLTWEADDGHHHILTLQRPFVRS